MFCKIIALCSTIVWIAADEWVVVRIYSWCSHNGSIGWGPFGICGADSCGSLDVITQDGESLEKFGSLVSVSEAFLDPGEAAVSHTVETCSSADIMLTNMVNVQFFSRRTPTLRQMPQDVTNIQMD